MGNRLRACLAEYWPFMLPVLLLLPGLSGFIYPGSGALFSDMAVTHYPNALFLQRAVGHSEVPLWSPQILSGFPFVAHPYSGFWYPPYWLVLLFPLPLGLNLVLAVHILLAGVGMYCFLCQRGFARQAAMIGGLAFQAAPRLFGHVGAGHVMLVMAVCLTPWLLWASGQRRLPAAMLLALIAAADPRWALYAAVLWGAWLLWQRRVRHLVEQAALASLLALPALWLYWQYGQLSTRASLSAAEILELSLPPASLLGLLLPQWGGAHEWIVYSGIVLLLLVLVAHPWQPKTRFWFAVIVACLLIALGSHIPGADRLAGLPGFSQLRIPTRALLLAAFAWAVLSAAAIQQLTLSGAPRRGLRLLHAGVFALLLAIGVLAWLQDAPLWRPALFAAVLTAAAWLAHERLAGQRLTLVLGGLLLADLLIASASLLRFRPADDVLAEGSHVAGFLAVDEEPFRVYSPDYSLPQQTAAFYGVELASGVDPLQLQSYVSFLATAGGYPDEGYSVVQPPLNANIDLDIALLSQLNVKYIVSAQPVSADGLGQVQVEPYIYFNPAYRPRAWVEQGGVAQPATVLDAQANRMTVHAYGPGLLILAEVQYPGWRLFVDRQPAEFASSDGPLRTVALPDGEHEIVLHFMPDALRFGVPIAALAWLACIGILVRRRA
ncbi:MAG: hypothetical protein KIT08_09450 [Anaerolineales bacterium]|nr:MAG: hypothetical protein KIT08_09450 [Anaerolineales bacterium]